MNVKAIVLFLFMISLIGVTGCMNAENKILSHVESTYDEEFEVENVKKGSIIFSEMYGKDKAIVHPKGNKEMVFLAGEYRDDEGKYYDSYVLSKWGEELKASLQNVMKEELSESPFKVVVYAKTGTYDASMIDTPFSEFIEKNREHVRIMVVAAIHTDREPDVDNYSDGIYNIYKEVSQLGAERYGVSVGFVDKSEDILDYIRTANVNNIAWSNLDAKLYGYLSIDERVNPENQNPRVDKELMLTGPDAVVNHYKVLGE